jgi:hypothetical protein
MSKTEWAGLLLVAGFALWMIVDRLERLGKQLAWMTTRLREDMAELAGKSERARELREEWRRDQDEERKEKRLDLITWALLALRCLHGGGSLPASISAAPAPRPGWMRATGRRLSCLPMPAPGERLHRALACRLVAVRRRARQPPGRRRLVNRCARKMILTKRRRHKRRAARSLKSTTALLRA